MNDKNLMTKTMDKAFGMMSRTSKKFEQMGQIPYGMEKATRTERRQMSEQMRQSIEGLRPEQWQQMINEVGPEKVEEFLENYVRAYQNGNL